MTVATATNTSIHVFSEDVANQDAGEIHLSSRHEPSINTCSSDAPTVIDEKEIETSNETLKNKWEANDAYDTGPDGGYGWLVVVGSFLSYFTSFGTETAWGVFQAYFEKNVFQDNPNAQFQLSFAGTLIGLMVNLMGPIFQILTARLGIRPVIQTTQNYFNQAQIIWKKPVVLGVIIMVLGLELAGFATQIWHLYLTQGVLFGTGAAFLYVSALSVPSQWFNKRKGLGLGLVTSGSGVGGVVLPFIISDLINRVGVAWTYRILGFVYLGMNAVTCVLVKEKYPRNKKVIAVDEGEQPLVKPPTLKEIFDFSILKDSSFLWWMVASMISSLGCFIPFFFLPSYALSKGLNGANATSLSAVLAGASCVGRITMGLVSDRIGRLNTLIISCAISTIAVFGIWIIAHDYNTIMAFAVVYGLVGTAYYSLVSPITSTIVGMKRFPTALSLMMLANIVSIMGPNIASAIENSTNTSPYLSYKLFTGACFALGGILLLGLKVKMTHSIFAQI